MISAVLPLRIDNSYSADDVLRVDLLFKSLWKYARNSFSEIKVVIPDKELRVALDKIGHWQNQLPLNFIGEEEFIPELADFRSHDGWRKQMIIKLWAALHSSTRFTVTFDADIICIRETLIEHLITENRAIMQLCRNNVCPNHWGWYEDSGRVLKTPVLRGEVGATVTPFICAKDIVKSLAEFIEKRHKRSFVHYLLKISQTHLVDRLPYFWRRNWSEYSLYYLHALRTDMLSEYHVECDSAMIPTKLLSDHSLWWEKDIGLWSPDVYFSKGEDAHFCAIQSNTGIAANHVTKLCLPYLS